LKRQVDELLVRVWHYFDEVVVEGLSADLLVQTAKVEPAVDEVAVRVLSQVELLLYLREIGALDLLVFREKPHAFCAGHFRQHAEELGIPAALDDALADEVVDYFAKTSTLEITEAEGERFLWFTHPDLDAGWALSMPSDRGEPDKRAIAARAFAQQCMALVSDVGQARNLRLPLTTVGHSLIRREASELDETSVALALNLPIVQGLGPRTCFNSSGNTLMSSKRFGMPSRWPYESRWPVAKRIRLLSPKECVGTSSIRPWLISTAV
jgi:hypothetical protein